MHLVGAGLEFVVSSEDYAGFIFHRILMLTVEAYAGLVLFLSKEMKMKSFKLLLFGLIAITCFSTASLAAAPGSYVGGSLILFVPHDSDVTDSGGDRGTFTYESGFGIGGFIGTRLQNNFRLEGALSFRSAKCAAFCTRARTSASNCCVCSASVASTFARSCIRRCVSSSAHWRV